MDQATVSQTGDGPPPPDAAGVKPLDPIKRIGHLNKFFNCIKFDLLLCDERRLESMNGWSEGGSLLHTGPIRQ